MDLRIVFFLLIIFVDWSGRSSFWRSFVFVPADEALSSLAKLIGLAKPGDCVSAVGVRRALNLAWIWNLSAVFSYRFTIINCFYVLVGVKGKDFFLCYVSDLLGFSFVCVYVLLYAECDFWLYCVSGVTCFLLSSPISLGFLALFFLSEKKYGKRGKMTFACTKVNTRLHCSGFFLLRTTLINLSRADWTVYMTFRVQNLNRFFSQNSIREKSQTGKESI